jgi:hypothetical protein
MMERTLMALAAAAAIAAAAAVGVFSAFFALYALVEPRLGAAGAAAVVSASAAVLVAVAGLIAARKVEGDRREATTATPDATMVDTILSLVRERPLLASGAAVAAGIYALRNPQLIAAVLRAFMDKPSNPKR